ncbi:MAG: YihY/virulence factor BrkB family protein [Cytophagaceae bacterium]|nr:YihY/virulence factor BrkB family protein [Cytophagaceae bacterium]
MKKYSLQLWETLKGAFTAFNDDNALKMSASLSYYTIFSLSPMLIIIISLCGLFFGREAVQGQIYGQIRGLVGESSAVQIQELIKNAELSNQSGFAAVIGVVILLIGATGVFAEIQDSINSIWSLKAKPKKSWLKYLINRLLSFSMIVSIGFLLLVSLVVSTALDFSSDYLQRYFSDAAVYLFYVINYVVVLAIISLLFAIIFKVLPDGYLRWRDALIGAAFTAVLFVVGKLLIGLYLGSSGVSSTYGAAGSIILILLWVYYTAAILYFGAEFTKVYAEKFGTKIVPKAHAVRVEKREIEQQPKGRKPKLRH